MFGWPGCCCNAIRFTVHGCNAMPLAGVTVTVSLSGTDYVGTTDAAGVVEIAVPGVGTYSWTITSPSVRLQSQSSTVVVAASGVTDVGVRTLQPATGYRCINWENTGGDGSRKCAFPVAETLYLTDSVMGAFTLIYNAGGSGAWEFTRLVAWGGCAAYPACPSKDVDHQYSLFALRNTVDGPLAVQVRGRQGSAQDKCPSNSGDVGLGYILFNYGRQVGASGESGFSLTCPTAATGTFAASFHYPATDGADGAVARFYCDTPADIEISE
jgi:hypothetical protein